MFRNRLAGGKAGADRQDLRCSFCNKGKHEVRKLIAGPSVCICDECVQICVDIIKDDDRFVAKPETGEPPAADRLGPLTGTGPVSVPCGLCQALTPISALSPIPGRGALCPGCLREIEAMLEGRRNTPD